MLAHEIELTDSFWLMKLNWRIHFGSYEIELTDLCWLMKLNWRIYFGSNEIELTDLCWLVKLNWRYYVLKWCLICNWIDGILLGRMNWRFYVLKYCSVRKSAVLLRYALQLLWIKFILRLSGNLFEILMQNFIFDLIWFKFGKLIWWYCASMTLNRKYKESLDGKRKLWLSLW
jgi:hypothetical protein